jgi:hypothetical protein
MQGVFSRPVAACCISAAAIAVSSAFATLCPSTAHARVSTDFSYTKQQTYSAALRFLRVDKGFEIVERDADAAYLIFSYPAPGQNGKLAQGTIEVIEVDESVKLIVQLPKMPEYHEQLLADGLLTKLKREYGEPPARKPKKRSSKKARSDKKAPADKAPEEEGKDDANSPTR